MSVFDFEGSSSFPEAFADPMLAGINGTDEVGFAGGIEGPEDELRWATAVEDGADELLLPQNKSGALKVAKSGAGTLEESPGEELPPGEEVDTLTGGSSDRLEVQTRGGLFDGAGDNRRTALNIGTLDGAKSYSDSVSRRDRKDFYKFKITEKTDVEIELDRLSGNADLYLLNNKGKVIEKSKRGGRKAEEIERTLTPGIYYARVQSRNKRVSASYNLNLEPASGSETLEKYEFTYYYSGSKGNKNLDYYNGYVYAPKGTYEVRSYYDFDRKDNEAGANGKYYISSSSEADAKATDGEVYLDKYYDVEKGKSYTPYYASGSLASGREGLGSEEDFIGVKYDREEDAVALDPKAFFGADNYGADIVQEARVPGSGNYQIDALLSNYKWGTDTITYSFYDDNNRGGYYGGQRGVREVSDKVKQNVRDILENIYEPLLELNFVEVNDTSNNYGLIRVMKSDEPSYAYAYYPYGSDRNTGSGQDMPGDVHLNPSYDGAGGYNNFQGGPGTHGYLTLIHELGHAVGLKHPGNYNGGGAGTPPFLPSAEDNTRNTVMSYNSAYAAETLMPYDIRALQYMYGSDSPTEAIAVTSPNGGNTLEPGKNYTITWNDNISENVKLELYKGGSFNSTINSSTASDGSYVWRVPTSVASGSDYKMKITSVSDSGVSDFSDSNFTVKTDEPNDFIAVTSPNGGNTLETGKNYNITWNDNIGENVRIYLYQDGKFDRILANSTPSDGSYNWTVPASLASSSNYTVAVQSVTNGSLYDFSDNNFTIQTAQPAGYINLTSPDGGNSVEPGVSYTITWNDNISENVKIELYKGGYLSSTISSSTSSDGSYVWTVPTSIARGSDYQVMITSVSDSSVSDYSQNYFSVKPKGYITVNYPDSNTLILAGDTYNIQWNDNISENVKIELYQDDRWNRTITSSTSSDGSYIWTVPTDLTGLSDYELKISSVSNSSVYDYSDRLTVFDWWWDIFEF